MARLLLARRAEADGAAVPEDLPGIPAFLVVGLLYWLGAALGSRLTMTPEGVSVLWPANAVLLAALLRHRGRRAAGFVIAVVIAEVLADLHKFSLGEALVFAGTNVVEACVAWLLLDAWRFDPRFERIADVGRFVLAAPLAGALVAASMGVLLLSAIGGRESSFLDAALLWWFGDALGLMVFTPLVLGFWVEGRYPLPGFAARPLVDAGMILGGLTTLGLLTAAGGHLIYAMHMRVVLLLPFVLYAAARLPFRWVCVVVTLVALHLTVLAVLGRAPYLEGDPQLAAVWTQETVLVMAVSALGLSALLTNVRIGEAVIRTANRQLQQRADALAQSNDELRRIAFVAAHDLQTPLRSIALFTQLLGTELSGRVSDPAEDWIRRITGNTRRLEALLRGLGKLAEVDAIALDIGPVDMNRLFDAAVRALADTCEEAGATVERDELPVVTGDWDALEQLLIELVCNATKYRGPAPLHVRVSAVARLDEWEIRVKDNGLGLPAEAQTRVFELFQRHPAGSDAPGTGLGLALCARVVHRHGGRIWIESEPGAGCTVHFTLPREAA